MGTEPGLQAHSGSRFFSLGAESSGGPGHGCELFE